MALGLVAAVLSGALDNPETGGVNDSAVHWDLICDLRRGAQITADGEVVQRDGKFSGR